MSPGKRGEERYFVKEVRGVCLGAGGFVVVDRVDGSEWCLTIWRDDAEKIARRWNTDHGELDIETWAPV